MSNETEAKARPTHRIYAVMKNGKTRANWQSIGVAFANKDGRGFNLIFTARPLEGAQIVLREPMSDDEAGAQ